jgi:hypothetical protein
VAVGEKFQDVLRVIADGGKLHALLFESWYGALQLDQLPFAEGSPIGGAEKEQHRSVFAAQRVQRLHMSKLIANGKGRGFLADGEPDGHQLDGGHPDGVVVKRAVDGDRVAQVRCHLLLRVQVVHQAIGVVVERELRAGNLFEAFWRLVEGFVGVATGRYEDARPGAGLCGGILCG